MPIGPATSPTLVESFSQNDTANTITVKSACMSTYSISETCFEAKHTSDPNFLGEMFTCIINWKRLKAQG